MLLLPVATHELSGPLLALASTLAGNLFIVGSIANIIVVDAAERRGVSHRLEDAREGGRPGDADHVRSGRGLPVDSRGARLNRPIHKPDPEPVTRCR